MNLLSCILCMIKNTREMYVLPRKKMQAAWFIIHEKNIKADECCCGKFLFELCLKSSHGATRNF
jgi:hypothetical protein